MAAGAFF